MISVSSEVEKSDQLCERERNRVENFKQRLYNRRMQYSIQTSFEEIIKIPKLKYLGRRFVHSMVNINIAKKDSPEILIPGPMVR